MSQTGAPARHPCPICGKPVLPADPEFPFCSQRCRIRDLANWAAGAYRIPGTPAPPQDDEE
ncbi:MAG: DNA gyrase inhibitor YacG [Terriglobales bacterium]